MYPNLRAEMARKKITASELAEKLGITISTMSIKLNGKSDFTLKEALKIRAILEADMPIEVLFEIDIA